MKQGYLGAGSAFNQPDSGSHNCVLARAPDDHPDMPRAPRSCRSGKSAALAAGTIRSLQRHEFDRRAGERGGCDRRPADRTSASCRLRLAPTKSSNSCRPVAKGRGAPALAQSSIATNCRAAAPCAGWHRGERLIFADRPRRDRAARTRLQDFHRHQPHRRARWTFAACHKPAISPRATDAQTLRTVHGDAISARPATGVRHAAASAIVPPRQ